MSKMTDEQIKKALECCDGSFGNCDECPYKNKRGCWQLEEDAIDLINRQQAEIEDYRRNIKQLSETLTGGNGLRIRVDNMIVYADDLEEWLEFCDKQRAEAIKEFAEKLRNQPILCCGCVRWYDIQETIVNLVKEMVGEGK